MYPDVIAIAIPFLIASVVVEYLYDRGQRNRQYSLNRSMSNISCGIAEQITGFLTKGLFFVCYAALYEHLRLFTLSDGSVWTWVALTLVVDLVFYLYHRAAHLHGILWAAHMIHHEVEEFNLTVALRRSVLQEVFIIPAYLPLAVLGFSPGAFFLMFALHNLYQFWIHTPHLPELRLLGYVLNTSHHHVVHHCRNERYVDKNFAGVFIIWDKMFGTFEAHTEQPEFGVHQETTTFNPVRTQVYTLSRVVGRALQQRGFVRRLSALFESPSWLGAEADARRGHGPRPVYNPRFTAKAGLLASLLFLLALGGVSVYRLLEAELSLTMRVGVLVSLGVIVYAIGMLLDGFGSQRSVPASSEAAAAE